MNHFIYITSYYIPRQFRLQAESQDKYQYVFCVCCLWQVLAGEISPFMCSGSHLVQVDTFPSSVHTILEGVSKCNPSVPIRPCILKVRSRVYIRISFCTCSSSLWMKSLSAISWMKVSEKMKVLKLSHVRIKSLTLCPRQLLKGWITLSTI